MSLISRKPREKDKRSIAFDARPPEARAADNAIDILKFGGNAPVYNFKTSIYELESEVMPIEAFDGQERTQSRHTVDIRPQSATGADRLNQIKDLIRSLTYGEMMELAAALWSKRENNSPVTEKEVPGIWHRWATK